MAQLKAGGGGGFGGGGGDFGGACAPLQPASRLRPPTPPQCAHPESFLRAHALPAAGAGDFGAGGDEGEGDEDDDDLPDLATEGEEAAK